jgi:hypothetical protein
MEEIARVYADAREAAKERIDWIRSTTSWAVRRRAGRDRDLQQFLFSPTSQPGRSRDSSGLGAERMPTSGAALIAPRWPSSASAPPEELYAETSARGQRRALELDESRAQPRDREEDSTAVSCRSR